MPVFEIEVTEMVAQRCTYYVEADSDAEAYTNAADGIGLLDRVVEPDTGRGEGEPMRRDVHKVKEMPPEFEI